MINIGAAGFMNSPRQPMGCISVTQETPDMMDKIVELEKIGYFLEPRNPKRNAKFQGKWMVIEVDDRIDGYCIVGDNKRELIDDAYQHLIAS